MTGHNRIPTKSRGFSRSDVITGLAVGIVLSAVIITLICWGTE
jgi:hypothetical protein